MRIGGHFSCTDDPLVNQETRSGAFQITDASLHALCTFCRTDLSTRNYCEMMSGQKGIRDTSVLLSLELPLVIQLTARLFRGGFYPRDISTYYDSSSVTLLPQVLHSVHKNRVGVTLHSSSKKLHTSN